MVSKAWKEMKKKEFEEIKERQVDWDAGGYKKGKSISIKVPKSFNKTISRGIKR